MMPITPTLQIFVQQLDTDLPLPTCAQPGDAGVDLCAREDATLDAGGGRALIPTGIAMAVPEGYAGFILPRSGLAYKHGVTCLNTPGLIDSGYRGEVKVLLINTDPLKDFIITRGERIAQLVVQEIQQIDWIPISNIGLSARGSGGFGSTGS